MVIQEHSFMGMTASVDTQFVIVISYSLIGMASSVDAHFP